MSPISFIPQIHFHSSKRAILLGFTPWKTHVTGQLVRAVQVFATPKSHALVIRGLVRGTSRKPTDFLHCIPPDTNSTSALKWTKWQTTGVQRNSRFADFFISVPRADMRKTETWGPSAYETLNSCSPSFALWLQMSDDLVMSRENHSHHLGHINKGSIIHHLGIIFLFYYYIFERSIM